MAPALSLLWVQDHSHHSVQVLRYHSLRKLQPSLILNGDHNAIATAALATMNNIKKHLLDQELRYSQLVEASQLERLSNGDRLETVLKSLRASPKSLPDARLTIKITPPADQVAVACAYASETAPAVSQVVVAQAADHPVVVHPVVQAVVQAVDHQVVQAVDAEAIETTETISYRRSMVVGYD